METFADAAQNAFGNLGRMGLLAGFIVFSGKPFHVQCGTLLRVNFYRKVGAKMKILGLGVPELLIILVVVLLIFGPKNLPKLGNALGRTVKGLRDGMGAGKKEATEASDDKDVVVEEVVEVAAEEPKTSSAASSEPAKKTVKKVVVKKAE